MLSPVTGRSREEPQAPQSTGGSGGHLPIRRRKGMHADFPALSHRESQPAGQDRPLHGRAGHRLRKGGGLWTK